MLRPINISTSRRLLHSTRPLLLVSFGKIFYSILSHFLSLDCELSSWGEGQWCTRIVRTIWDLLMWDSSIAFWGLFLFLKISGSFLKSLFLLVLVFVYRQWRSKIIPSNYESFEKGLLMLIKTTFWAFLLDPMILFLKIDEILVKLVLEKKKGNKLESLMRLCQ